MNSDLHYLHAFNMIEQVGAVTLRALRERFGSYEPKDPGQTKDADRIDRR